jgi:hypothetical protein
MKSLQGIFFWFGGVLVPALPEVTVREIYGRPFETVPPQTRLALRRLAQELALGKVDGCQYCQRALLSCQSSLGEAELAARILEGCTLQLSFEKSVDRLPAALSRWLVVDYPQDWFFPLARRLDVLSRFPEDRILFTSNFGLARFVPDVFDHILQQANLPLEAVMIVDGLVPRAVEAVRYGFSSTIFVDDRRLERDYKLRQLIS